MRAAVCEAYGPPEVVRIRDVPKPAPAAGEVLIAATATTVNSGDTRVRALRVPRGMRTVLRLKFGFRAPKQPVFGFDLAGRVEAVGDGVTRFRPGDRVVASRGVDLGCHAEYVAIPEDGTIAAVPEGLSDEEAVALCFGGLTAVHFLTHGNVAAGETVLVNGAAGAVGVMAVQLAKRRGAEVTAVCRAANAELVRSLGADDVIDYATTDFRRAGRRWDVILDNQANAPYSQIKGLLEPGGRLLMVNAELWPTIAASWQSATVSGTAAFSGDDLRALLDAAAAGDVRPVIGATLPFAEVAEAHRRVDGGHKVGSLVLTH